MLRLAAICAWDSKSKLRQNQTCTNALKLSTDIFIDTIQRASVCSVSNECSTEGARRLAECDQTTVKFSANQKQCNFAQL
jgi:hypothetical protein